MNIPQNNDECFSLQNKVFTRWINEKFKRTNQNMKIEDITKDLTNGVVLFQLAQTLTKSNNSEQNNSEIKLSDNITQNYQSSIDMFTKDGVELNEISVDDINENYDKKILKFIWKLISHYSIRRSLSSLQSNKDNNQMQLNTNKLDENNKETLLSWAYERVSAYPYIKNFQPYVLAICALLDSYVPEKINYYSLDPNDSEHNLQLAFETMKYLGIPIYLYSEDILPNCSQLDEKVLLTQLASFKIVLDIQKTMTESFSISKSDEESKKVEELEETSSNTFAESEYDSYSSSESQDKLNSNDSPISTLSTVLFETQKVTQKQIEKLMGKVELLTQQLYESRGKVGELTRQLNISQKTISELKEQLNESQSQSKTVVEAENVDHSVIAQLKQQLLESENKIKEMTARLMENEDESKETIQKLNQKIVDSESNSKELESKLLETEKNDQQTINELSQKLEESQSKANALLENQSEISNLTNEIAQLKQKLSDSENQNKEMATKMQEIESKTQETILQLKQQILDSESHSKELESKLSETEKNDQQTINELNQKLEESQSKANALLENQSEISNLTNEIAQLKQKLSDSEIQNKEMSNKMQEIESKSFNNELSFSLNLYNETFAGSNQTDEIARLTKENERIKNELFSSLTKEASLTQKLRESENNYNIILKQFSETRVSMRKELYDSEMKSHVFSINAQKEIDELTAENSQLKEELTNSQKKNENLSNELSEMKKKSDFEINNLMIALSDAENRCVTFYHQHQSEIESLKEKLADSQDQIRLHKYEFDQLKQAFTDSQEQVCKYYQELCDLQSLKE
ncbi:alpha-actinin [Tritrichomonas musculus]|uniref:Alpha-actinin n=1 Tax=Tritrichomonas musculus TaxID=1915356 RepID=A0ABR2L1T7_9EUKA